MSGNKRTNLSYLPDLLIAAAAVRRRLLIHTELESRNN
jgi:hypothetical protein